MRFVNIFLAGVIGCLMIASSTLALNVSVSVDKNTVMMGDTINLSGKIAFDNGTTSKFVYRTAVIAPKGIIVCDSNRTMTGTDGKFSLTCKIPSQNDSVSLGIPGALSRAVIPYAAGIVVKDPDTNHTLKRYTKEIIAINQEKFDNEMNGMVNSIDKFIASTNNTVTQCNAVAERALKFNLTDVTDRCLEIQGKINDLILNATLLKDQIAEMRGNATKGDIEHLRDRLKSLRDSQKELTSQLKDTREAVAKVKWSELKTVRKSDSEIKKEVENRRTQIAQKIDERKGLRR